MRKVYSPELTPELLAQSERLAAMSDDDIDLSDMPEKLDWSNAVRGKFYRPFKQQLTLRLDADVIEWFKSHPEGSEGYQTRINSALRHYVDEKVRKAG